MSVSVSLSRARACDRRHSNYDNDDKNDEKTLSAHSSVYSHDLISSSSSVSLLLLLSVLLTVESAS